MDEHHIYLLASRKKAPSEEEAQINFVKRLYV